MRGPIISEPFASKIVDTEFYDVIFEILIPIGVGGAVESAYAALDHDYQLLRADVAKAIAATEPGNAPRTGFMLEPQECAVAPYLFAKLLGSDVRALASSNASILAKIWPNTAVSRQSPYTAQATLVSQILTEPLASRVRAHPLALQNVIIDLDVDHTRATARTCVIEELNVIAKRLPAATSFNGCDNATHPYVFATMTGYAILALVDLDRSPLTRPRGVHRIWEDAPVRPLITDSVATIKADAAHAAFSAVGRGIVWAVIDSGIDNSHPHFDHFSNLKSGKTGAIAHRDCRSARATPADVVASNEANAHPTDDSSALEDPYGHGTHVAGIIAGGMSTEWPEKIPVTGASDVANKNQQRPAAIVTTRNETGVVETQHKPLEKIAGMAPQCSLVSLRVLDESGNGNASSIIAAIDMIQQWNDHGRNLMVHGVNLSIGCPFEAEWFACGQSPLCIEVDRLVDCGVVVVIAAGNGGYGYLQSEGAGALSLGLTMSISDPGNSELAITVGSTHRTAPHRYGVSYFSAKGPTGDGRMKPDLLGPGERIISCASAQSRFDQTVVQDDASPPSCVRADEYTYKEDSGTSMAAPHVSGVIAAFLSIRREYIGRPRDVKAIFMAAATDLRRDKNHQGAGLVDLMRAIQSV